MNNKLQQLLEIISAGLINLDNYYNVTIDEYVITFQGKYNPDICKNIANISINPVSGYIDYTQTYANGLTINFVLTN